MQSLGSTFAPSHILRPQMIVTGPTFRLPWFWQPSKEGQVVLGLFHRLEST